MAAALQRHGKRIAGGALLVLALALGSWAHDLARAEALETWLKEHPPSARLWRHALLTRGLTELREPGAIHRVARTLPSQIDLEGTVWTGSSFEWVVLFIPQNDGNAFAVFCLRCQAPPLDWAPAGNGWQAFDPVLDGVERASARMKSETKPQKKAQFRDPREVVY